MESEKESEKKSPILDVVGKQTINAGFSVAIAAGIAMLSSLILSAWALLQGYWGPWIALMGLAAFALTLFIAVEIQKLWRIAAARTVLIILGLLVIYLSATWLTGIFNELKQLRAGVKKSSADTLELATLKPIFERYKRLVEKSELPDKTTMIEFTNKELKNRATTVYQGIQKMNTFFVARADAADKRLGNREITSKKRGELFNEDELKRANEYEKNFRVDASMVYGELKNRIPYERRNTLPTFPDIAFVPDDKRAGNVNLMNLMPSTMAVQISDILARNIEELTKLLPDD